MSHQRVETGAGWTWITRGWDIFMKNPGIWLVLALILGIIYFVLNFIPIIGGLAASVLGPALFGGLIYGARELDHDRSLEITHLFQAFQDSDRTVPMLLLGLVPLAAAIVGGILAVGLVAGTVGTAAITGSESAAMGMMAGGGLMVFLVMVIIGLVVGALLLFSVPRVMFGHAEPIPAVKDSVQAVLSNIGAYIVFALIYIGLAILAAIPFGLGFLILMPVMAGAVYTANKQVFGGSDPTEEMPVTPAGNRDQGDAQAPPAAPGGDEERPGPEGGAPPESESDEPPRT